jgi:ParB family chromosome partitioning protein
MTPVDTANAEAVETAIRVPLNAKLKLAPENVRQDGGKNDDVSGLADSIGSRVGLINPLSGYVEDGCYFVTTGGRRRRALLRLQREKRLPVDIKVNGVPFVVKPKAIAVEASLAENEARAAMTLAQQIQSYADLASKGLEPHEIGAVTSSSALRVAQLLRLSRVPAPVFEAFTKEQIDLDVLKAFASSTDTARQAAVWEQLSEGGGYVHAHSVRSLLRNGTVSGTNSRALFVGRTAYLEAGGGIENDLFAARDTEIWLDGALVEQLALDKLDVLAERVRAEGWGDVQIIEKSYGYQGRLERAYPARREMTEAETAAFEAATAIIRSEDACPYQQAEAFSTKQELEEAVRQWTDEERAAGTVFIYVEHQGKVTIERGWFAPQRSASSGGAGLGGGGVKPAFGHAGHERMTRIATTAVRNAVALSPTVAFDADLAHKAWFLFRQMYQQGYALPDQSRGAEPAEGITVRGDREFEDLYGSWDDRLPRNYLEFFPAIVALSQSEKMELFALCVGASINAVSQRADYHRERAWAQLGLIAAHAGVDMAAAWTPEAEFLKGASKSVLLQSLRDMEVDAEPHAKEPKGVLVEVVARSAKKAKWVPPMLAALTTPTLSEEENRGRGADPAGDDDLSDDDFADDEGEAA